MNLQSDKAVNTLANSSWMHKYYKERIPAVTAESILATWQAQGFKYFTCLGSCSSPTNHLQGKPELP